MKILNSVGRPRQHIKAAANEFGKMWPQRKLSRGQGFVTKHTATTVAEQT